MPSAEAASPANALFRGDNLTWMTRLPSACCDLIYVDPPFGTDTLTAGDARAEGAGRRAGGPEAYLDFLTPRLEQCRRLLAPRGTLYVHLDWRTVHYVKVRLDELFGRDNFLNEIVWSYRTGGVGRRWFARKHDTILSYARKRGAHVFNVLRAGRYRTDGLSNDERGRPYKVTRNGRLYFHPAGPALTDVWNVPFLSTVSRERVNYPSQKPLALLERIVLASSNPGDLVADFFCGSGTTLVAAQRLGRKWMGCDVSERAVKLARRRMAEARSAYQMTLWASKTGPSVQHSP